MVHRPGVTASRSSREVMDDDSDQRDETARPRMDAAAGDGEPALSRAAGADTGARAAGDGDDRGESQPGRGGGAGGYGRRGPQHGERHHHWGDPAGGRLSGAYWAPARRGPR